MKRKKEIGEVKKIDCEWVREGRFGVSGNILEVKISWDWCHLLNGSEKRLKRMVMNLSGKEQGYSSWVNDRAKISDCGTVRSHRLI